MVEKDLSIDVTEVIKQVYYLLRDCCNEVVSKEVYYLL